MSIQAILTINDIINVYEKYSYETLEGTRKIPKDNYETILEQVWKKCVNYIKN